MTQMRLSSLLWAAGVLVGPAAAVCVRSILAFSGDTCASISAANGITVSQFVQWNGGLSSCTLTPGRSYCVLDTAIAETSDPPPGSTTIKPSTSKTGGTGGPTTQPGLTPSPDGTCGPGTGFTCDETPYGTCCSEHGYCGDTTGHCGFGCQEAFGVCRGGNCEGGATTTVFVTQGPSTCPSGGGVRTVTATNTLATTRTLTATATATTTTTATTTRVVTQPGGTSTITVLHTVSITVTNTVTAPGGTKTVTVTTTAGSQPGIPVWRGTIPTCTKYYQLLRFDTCRSIIEKFGLSNSRFTYWNPELDCDYLDEARGYNICIGIPGS